LHSKSPKNLLAVGESRNEPMKSDLNENDLAAINLDPDKDLNFDIIEKQFKLDKPPHLLSLYIRNRNAKIGTTIVKLSTKLKSLNAHNITNAKVTQEKEKKNQ
jgi:hypothetical protein